MTIHIAYGFSLNIIDPFFFFVETDGQVRTLSNKEMWDEHLEQIVRKS